MTDLEIIKTIQSLQESILDLTRRMKAQQQSLSSLFDCAISHSEHLKTQSEHYQELQAQLNLVLLFVTVKLSTTRQFAAFVSDVVEANEVCQGRDENNSTYLAAKALLEGGLRKYLSVSSAPRPPAASLPDNVEGAHGCATTPVVVEGIA